MTDAAEFNYEAVPTVRDWATDWDHYDRRWSQDPFPIWDDLKSKCPMAHTKRYNEGAWLPLTFDQIDAIAHDTKTFSSVHNALTAGGSQERMKLPPIHLDPPDHAAVRRAILPFFAPKAIEQWRPKIASHCARLAASIAERGFGDAATDYAEHIPVHAIASILGIDPGRGDDFRRWVVDFIVHGARDPELRSKTETAISAFMLQQIADRRQRPGEDLISHLIGTEIDGRPLDDDLIVRILILQLVAGIDTTWSSIGAALWHLATHDDDRRRLVAEPELIPTATEELLRAYAPVFVARNVVADAVIDGVEMAKGDTVFMTFPIACRDETKFERPNEVIIDRDQNRHLAFGVGIHRCLGSNLARLEMHLAISEFLRHIPEYSLAASSPVVWTPGQIRGPRRIPIIIP